MASKIKIDPKWDNLTKTAAEARNAGMTYGKFQGLRFEKARQIREATEKRFKMYLAAKKKKTYCENCGSLIPKNSDFTDFCCKECKEKWEKKQEEIREHGVFNPIAVKMPVPKFCVNCGKQLTGRQKLYCSTECKFQYYSKSFTDDPSEHGGIMKNGKRLCQICGKEIIEPGRRYYCSEKCSIEARNVNRRERRQREKMQDDAFAFDDDY